MDREISRSSFGSVFAAPRPAQSATRAWQSLAPLPEILGAASAEASGGTIFVAGGWDDDTNIYSSRVYTYDVASDHWATADSQLSVGRCAMADGLLEGRYAFFVGGYVDQSPPNLSQVDVLDVFTGAVAAGAPLPEARSAARASVVGARLFVMGGGVYNQEQMNPYDPRPDVWEFVPSP